MSHWTHIVATIDVETFIEDKNIKGIIENKLLNAPKITGSERNADLFVNVLSGYNSWISADCNSCEYKDTIVDNEDGSFNCGADNDYKCPDSEYQTRVVITVIGDLRDREKEITWKEFVKFYKYIVKDCGFWVRNKCVKIID